MKRKFSTSWKASKQPRKQRKYVAKAPLHLKRKLIGANLPKDLRKKYGVRTVVVRKGDVVKVMRGKFKKKQGKVLRINTKKFKLIVEGITVKKIDGSKVEVPIPSSKVQIVELNLEDKKRLVNQDLDKKEESKNKIKEKKNAPEKK